MADIQKMVEVTKRRGYSDRYPWKVRYKNGEWYLYHYGTLVVTVDRRVNGGVELGGGYSSSDRDGINRFFGALEVPYFCTNARTKTTLRKYEQEYGKPINDNGYMAVFMYRR